VRGDGWEEVKYSGERDAGTMYDCLTHPRCSITGVGVGKGIIALHNKIWLSISCICMTSYARPKKIWRDAAFG
jgi:hypothetical protein